MCRSSHRNILGYRKTWSKDKDGQRTEVDVSILAKLRVADGVACTCMLTCLIFQGSQSCIEF